MTAIITKLAQTKLAEVSALVSSLAAAEQQLEKGYGKLAFMLKDVSENRYWDGEYKSFSEYLTYLSSTYRLGRAQFYNYLSAARDLNVTEDQLNTMGISKALVLRDAKNFNPILPVGAVKAALDPEVTTKELKEILFKANHVPPPDEGEWMDLNFEFMVTPEERLVLENAANAARHGDPTVSEKLKPSAQLKAIALKWAMEYLSSNSNDVVEGGKNF
jgi:hypothetical protein